MRVVPLNNVEVRSRQRTSDTIQASALSELRDSILRSGLLHPPVCWLDPSTQKYVLVVGERRFRAIQQISESGKEFQCSLHVIPVGNIPITEITDYLDEVGRFEAELDENIHRVDLPWPDRCRAFSQLHSMRKQQNPSQTARDTAKELHQKIPSADEHHLRNEIRRANILAPHLSNPKIANARNEAEAVGLVYRLEEQKAMAALALRRISEVDKSERTIEVRHGDLLELLEVLEAGTFDLILADPPYGIDASSGGFRSRSVVHHNYEDTAQNAREIAKHILTEGFRITKPRANLLMFCDIDLFPWLKMTAANMGWVPFRRPLIWQKSESEGLAPWGGQGPRITTEFLFYATKGQRGMNASPIDLFNVRRVPRNERLHGAEKPVDLLRRLIEATTLPGDQVLDPCCGSGSTLVACRESKRRALGIEKDIDYYNTSLANVSTP